ncbi:MAG: hypothetical protein ABSF71_34220 [Terriglobia bacterium]|jgi:hypothetical protein
MNRLRLLFTILILSVALPLVARPQQPESLGDVARQLREQREKDAKKATKVFTNDNLPAPKPMEAVTTLNAPPESPSTPTQTASKPAGQPAPGETKSKPSESSDDKVKTRDYWQDRFRAARQDVARVKEQQQLAEDELNLLQIQQAREMDPIAKQDLDTKVQAKQSEVDINKATTDAAQKNLDDLAKEFKDSGAPEEWSQTEHAQGQT